MKILEQQIIKSILDYLQILENQGKLFFFRSAAGGIKTADRFFRTGRKGVQDITCLIKGRYVAIEVKTETGRQSPEQKEIERLVNKQGGEYHIVRSFDELRKLIH